MKKNSIKKFTLIEMLAVIAIASVLIAVFTPAFNRMMFGSKVDQAASNFKLGLGMAQSKAVASRKYVAMIIPCFASEITDARLKQYALGGYRLAFVRKNGSSFEFIEWVSDSSWRNPDDGARLVRIDEPSVNSDGNYEWTELLKGKGNSGNLSDNDLLPAVDKANITKSTKLFKIEYDSTVKDPDMDALTQDNHTAIVFSPHYGIVNTIKPLSFYFTETKMDTQGNIEYLNRDNTLQFALNAVTGRTVFVDQQ